MKLPQDNYPYPQDPRSQPLAPDLPDGGYAYVRDTNGLILGVPDGPHLHPRILGGGKAALYAGDLTLQGGKVIDLTNLSGTFQFDDEEGLRRVAEQLRQQGMSVELGAVRFFPPDASAPVILE
jgi:hypothetical protein